MAARRVLRERKAAEKGAQELAEGAKKKPTRLEAEYTRGFRDGFSECKRLSGN